MIVGIGIDVCPIERMAGIIERHGEVFTGRVFTPTELAYAGTSRARPERLAARFAAKEATIKALGAPSGMHWKDIAVEKEPSGAPCLRLHGVMEREAMHLTLTHAGGIAVAVVVLEGAD
ncbi:MAG: holo-ACP synthase [Myxococcota bacterium]|nr:holo-ACP synthase [Myxococcota bacterium]